MMLSRTVRAVCGAGPGSWTAASRFTVCSERSHIIASCRRCSPFCTATGDTTQTPTPQKKQGPLAQGQISNVGRNIPHRHIQVISDTGENLGTMHRADVIAILNKKGLKLVLLNERKDPPVYQLMSGKQIYEEQLKQREKPKKKAAPVQVKELTFSSNIAAHDLSTKLKQVESWLEKKHHVKITLRSVRWAPEVVLDTTLKQMLEQMEMMVGFVSMPTVKADGKEAICIVRPPSAKELSQKGKNKAAQSTASPASKTDTSQEEQ